MDKFLICSIKIKSMPINCGSSMSEPINPKSRTKNNKNMTSTNPSKPFSSAIGFFLLMNLLTRSLKHKLS